MAASAIEVRARGPSRVASAASSALLVLTLALAVLAGAAAVAGYRGQVVLSGSMRPGIEPGDLVVAKRMAAAEIRRGQIVSFSAPDGSGVTITHRVVEVKRTASGDVAVVTRGDANGTSERWRTGPDASVGRIVATIPKLGLATRWAATRTGRLIVFSVLGGLLLLIGLRWVWRR